MANSNLYIFFFAVSLQANTVYKTAILVGALECILVLAVIIWYYTATKWEWDWLRISWLLVGLMMAYTVYYCIALYRPINRQYDENIKTNKIESNSQEYISLGQKSMIFMMIGTLIGCVVVGAFWFFSGEDNKQLYKTRFVMMVWITGWIYLYCFFEWRMVQSMDEASKVLGNATQLIDK